MKTKSAKGVLKINPSQAVNISTLDLLAKEFEGNLSKAVGTTSVEVDLSQTDEADSGTIKFLIAAANDCRQRGLILRVRATEKIAELLCLLNINQCLYLIVEEGHR